MGTIVYKYGLLPPHEGAELVDQQLRLAWEYRKALVELERQSRAERREVLRANGDVASAQAAVQVATRAADEAWRAICRHRAKSRSKNEPAEMREALKAARATKKEAGLALAEARKLWRERPEAQAEIDRMNEAASAARRERGRDVFGVANGRGLRQGTYGLIEESDAKARRSPLYDGAEPNDPRWPRWDGCGNVGEQIQGGMTWDAACASTDTRLRITAAEPRPRRDGQPRRGIGSQAGTARLEAHGADRERRTLWLRVGSRGPGQTVWAKWTLCLHRPLPPGAQIMHVYVRKRLIGQRVRWSVDFVIRVPEKPSRTGLAVAVDIGWRQLHDGVRVCAWHGEDGRHDTLHLPNEVLHALRHPGALRSVRDERFNAAIAQLRAFLQITTVPDWLREATTAIHAWKSPGRLVSLLRQWRDNRFTGDDGIWWKLADPINRQPIEGRTNAKGEPRTERLDWLGKDTHLWQFESDERQKGLEMRKHLYRQFGVDLARAYDTVVFEDFDLSRVARRSTGQEHENETARGNRQLASVSELRECVRNAFRQRGKTCVEVPAHKTTKTCHVCGTVNEFDAATLLTNRCDGCGEVWDQDENAAEVLLALHVASRERPSDDESGGGARGGENPGGGGGLQETRRQKSKRMAKERKERLGIARAVDSKAAE